jgi:serine/threonine protein kinase
MIDGHRVYSERNLQGSVTPNVALASSQRNSIHRDVEPENLMFRTRELDSDVPLGDFGLGKAIEEGLADSRVGTKAFVRSQVRYLKDWNRGIRLKPTKDGPGF